MTCFCSLSQPFHPGSTLGPGICQLRLCVSRMPPTPVLSPLDRSPSYAEDSPTSGTPTPLRQVGTWDPLLQCLSLDTPLLEQRNTKKPYRTKNNCRPAQLAKFWTKDTKRAKNLTVLLNILKQKQGMGSTEQGTAHHLHSTPPEAKEKSEERKCSSNCDPMDCGPPGSSVHHGILQARILEWVGIPFSTGSSQPRDQTQISYITGRFLLVEPPGKPDTT